MHVVLYMYTCRAVGAGPAGAAAAGPKFGTPAEKNGSWRGLQMSVTPIIRFKPPYKQPHSTIVKYHRHDRVALHCQTLLRDESVTSTTGCTRGMVRMVHSLISQRMRTCSLI